MKGKIIAYTDGEVMKMFVYLGDNDTVFNAALKEDETVRRAYESLPGALRERVRAAGLYSPQEISAYISALMAPAG